MDRLPAGGAGHRRAVVHHRHLSGAHYNREQQGRNASHQPRLLTPRQRFLSLLFAIFTMIYMRTRRG